MIHTKVTRTECTLSLWKIRFSHYWDIFQIQVIVLLFGPVFIWFNVLFVCFFFCPFWTILLSLLRPPSSVPHGSDHHWPPGVSTDGSKWWGSGVTPAVESACWRVSKVKFNMGKCYWQTLSLCRHSIGSLITNFHICICYIMFFRRGPWHLSSSSSHICEAFV